MRCTRSESRCSIPRREGRRSWVGCPCGAGRAGGMMTRTSVRNCRTPYVAILEALTTLALAAGYIAWSGTSVAELLTAGWGWDILGGFGRSRGDRPPRAGLPSRLRPEVLSSQHGSSGRESCTGPRKRSARDLACPRGLAGCRCARWTLLEPPVDVPARPRSAPAKEPVRRSQGWRGSAKPPSPQRAPTQGRDGRASRVDR